MVGEQVTRLIKWMGADGLLHFLVCYALMLTITPLENYWWAIGATIAASATKEAWDYFVQKDNTMPQVLHDVIMDVAGILAASIFILLT